MSAYSDNAKALHKTMAAHLRTQRKSVGLTMRVMSEKLGTAHSFIGKIEGQDRRLDIAEFVLYCEGMGKDPRLMFDQMLSASGK